MHISKILKQRVLKDGKESQNIVSSYTKMIIAFGKLRLVS